MPNYKLLSSGGSFRATYNNITNVMYQGSRIVYLYGPRDAARGGDASRLVAIICLGDDSRLEISE